MTTITWLWICVACWTLGNACGAYLSYRAYRKSADKALEDAKHALSELGEVAKKQIEAAYDERDAAEAKLRKILEYKAGAVPIHRRPGG